MSAARPLVSVRALSSDVKEYKSEQVAVPAVLLAPIRPDIVNFVHTNMAKNKRQPYAVKEMAGHQHSAESWGTGRAVARVPRVSGGGTSRAGQGAFANMCRKGRMFGATKIWRKWHRKINTNQKRYAVASALAASAVPALVQARGHRTDGIPEIPLVIDNAAEGLNKTKLAIKALEAVGAYADVEKARDSRKIRRGVGKMRNRRHVQRRGPLVVYAADNGIVKAFRNLPGVEVANVSRLNLLQLAPGGHLGRLIIWTRDAFAQLNKIYGSTRRESTQKSGWKVPRNIMTNTDVTRLINSDEVQGKVRSAIKGVHRAIRKKNPLTNLGALVKLNPYAQSLRRSELLAEKKRAEKRAAVKEAARKNTFVALTPAEQRKAARGRTHEPQQRANYQRILGGEFSPLPKIELKVQKPRDRKAPPAEVKEKKKKVRKPKVAKEEVKVEKKAAPAPAKAAAPAPKEEKKAEAKKPEAKKAEPKKVEKPKEAEKKPEKKADKPKEEAKKDDKAAKGGKDDKAAKGGKGDKAEKGKKEDAKAEGKKEDAKKGDKKGKK